MDILRKLFFGEVFPAEQMKPDSEAFQSYAKEFLQLEKQINDCFDEESRKMVEALMSAESKMNMEEIVLAFSHGFRLGIQFLLAAM